MAMDLALLHAAAARDQAVLRTYAWERPTVSFGRNEAVRGVWDVDAMQADGLDVVRRPTGGRALLHTREVTYSVTMPWPAECSWRDAYDAVNQRLLQALSAVGVPVRLQAASASRALLCDGTMCFAAPSAGELVTDAGKVAGSAVWRADGGYLQHGSILLHDDQARLRAYRVASGADDALAADSRAALIASCPTTSRSESRAASLAESLGNPLGDADHSGLATRVIASLRTAFACELRDSVMRPASAIDERSLSECRAMVSSPNWLWRR